MWIPRGSTRVRRSGVLATLVVVLIGATGASGQTPDAVVQRIKATAPFQQAVAFLDGDYDRFVKELITLTEIPAPPFKEQKRAAAYLEMLRDLGLSDVEKDEEGNVMGLRKGTAGGTMLAVLGTLETVFSDGNDET